MLLLATAIAIIGLAGAAAASAVGETEQVVFVTAAWAETGPGQVYRVENC